MVKNERIVILIQPVRLQKVSPPVELRKNKMTQNKLEARRLSSFVFFHSLQILTHPHRSKTAVLADHRIRIMNEVVSGIRIIKMYAWEIPFSAVVTGVRR